METLEICRGQVQDLAIKHRAKYALRALMAVGPSATLALREGLSHPEPAVRIGCCQVLDHFMDEAALPICITQGVHSTNGSPRRPSDDGTTITTESASLAAVHA